MTCKDLQHGDSPALPPPQGLQLLVSATAAHLQASALSTPSSQLHLIKSPPDTRHPDHEIPSADGEVSPTLM